MAREAHLTLTPLTMATHPDACFTMPFGFPCYQALGLHPPAS